MKIRLKEKVRLKLLKVVLAEIITQKESQKLIKDGDKLKNKYKKLKEILKSWSKKLIRWPMQGIICKGKLKILYCPIKALKRNNKLKH